MSTVQLVDERCDHPTVRQVFADVQAAKKIDFAPAIWRALATHPEHRGLCWTSVV